MSELLHLPAPRELSKGVNVNDGKILLLGASTGYRNLTIFEDIAIRNYSPSLRYKEFPDSIKGIFYARFKSWKLSPFLLLAVITAVQKGITIVLLWKMGISLTFKAFSPLRLIK